jgi:hypothetical protein
MTDWRSLLKADPADWLLESENPSVRYFTLIDLLRKNEDESDVKEAKTAIMKTGPVPQILAKQKNEGHWEKPTSFYSYKYKGTVWQLLILAELGADERDERIKRACEFILSSSQDRESGGFSAWQSMKTGGGRYAGVIPCLTGNMVWSLIRFGYLSDPRVQKGINWIVKYQRFDDGVKEAAKGRPYDKLIMCFGKHSCHMGVVKALKALAEIPADKRSIDVKRTIEKGAEYMLQHHVYKKSHKLEKVSKPGWLHFSFPLMYQTDVLEILGILTKLGLRDSRMQEAVDLVVSKQDEHGKWKLENTFNGKFQVDIERKGEPSKWITLNALRVMKRFYS